MKPSEQVLFSHQSVNINQFRNHDWRPTSEMHINIFYHIILKKNSVSKFLVSWKGKNPGL